MSISSQVQKLLLDYPQSKIVENNQNKLIWRCELTPTPLSDTYTIEIRYSYEMPVPEVYVIKPIRLLHYPGEDKLPHVFDSEKQQICLHLFGEWNRTMAISTTYVPWSSRWLFSYETWVVSGVWIGKSFHNGEYTF